MFTLSNDYMNNNFKVKNTKSMIVIFFRTLITFSILLTVMRLMGKRQIGEMQPFEFVITLLIAELACLPLADVSIPLVYGIIAVLAVFLLHQIISVLEQFGQAFKKVFSGKPSLVINKNGIDVKELKRNNLDVEDLIGAMRGAGYYAFDDVAYAIFEANGNLSVMPNCSEQSEPSLPILLINCGRVIKNNYTLLNLPPNFNDIILKEHNISKIKDVTVLTLDGNGKAYLQVKNRKYSTFNLSLPEGVKW